jgi:GH25 family lysozyme M1 (1,4-beta-N-acetylmuramidase)
MTTFGWDASHYDDPPGARDGIDFYTHKLTDGDHFYLDPEYRAAMDAARAVGIPVLGAYHVLHGQRSLRSQAQWMVERADALTPWWRTWPYWIWQMDCEPFGYNIRPTVAECNAFGHELMAASGRPLHAVEGYLPAWSYGSDVTLLEFPWWQSSYVAGSGPYRSLYPGDTSSRWTAAGRRADFLQYSSSAVIAGQTTCDANAFVGTLDDLKTFLGMGIAPTPPAQNGGNGMYFFGDEVGTQYVADSDLERYWVFSGPDRQANWTKARAVAGNPTGGSALLADINAGLFGKNMGAYAAPRSPAPCIGVGDTLELSTTATVTGVAAA